MTRLLSRWLEKVHPAKAPSRLPLHSDNFGKDHPIKRPLAAVHKGPLPPRGPRSGPGRVLRGELVGRAAGAWRLNRSEESAPKVNMAPPRSRHVIAITAFRFGRVAPTAPRRKPSRSRGPEGPIRSERPSIEDYGDKGGTNLKAQIVAPASVKRMMDAVPKCERPKGRRALGLPSADRARQCPCQPQLPIPS